MKHLGLFKADTLVKTLNYIGVPAAFIYVFSMVLWPIMSSGVDWKHIQDTWDRWQSLNVGMLAFISSITAFNIAKFNAEKQREREFAAAKAFLPAALSELTSYFRASARTLNSAWNSVAENTAVAEAPNLPSEYKTVFSDCIRHADPQIGDYLSNILKLLQIHHSRITTLTTRDDQNNRLIITRSNILSYFCMLGELQALVNKQFEFARNLRNFDESPIQWDDYRTSYRNLDIPFEDIRLEDQLDLESYTRRKIGRGAITETGIRESFANAIMTTIISNTRDWNHNKQSILLMIYYFTGMLLAAGILFFLAAGLSDPFKQLVIYMNDRTTAKSAREWALFFLLSVPVGAFWAGAWLWFKGCEKRFLDVFFAKAPTAAPSTENSVSSGPTN